MVEYDDYKEINLPWLKKIPSNWDIERNKQFLHESKETVGDKSSEYTLLSLTLRGIVVRDLSDNKGKFPASFDTYKVVEPGDMAFCLFDVDETPRTVGLSNHRGMLTGAYDIFHVDGINAQYLYYYYLALDNVKALRPLYTGLRKTININTFLSQKMPVPPRAEQDQIVRFLDWKVSAINKLIGIRRKEIQELEEMKRSKIGAIVMGQSRMQQKKSDITWVDTIPINWEEKPLIQYAYERCIKNVGMVEDNLLSLSYGKVIDKDINTTDGLLPASFEGYQIVEPGNIILRLTDLQNDHKSLRTGLVTRRGIITSAYTCLETRDDILPEYLQLELHVADLCKVFYGMGGGVRQSIGFKDIKRMIIAIPPLSEQHEILDLIHDIDAPIDKQKEQYLKIINELEELKKAIISDVVTGKIDVQNVTVPEYEHVDDIADIDSEGDEETDESEIYGEED
ncbi:MAG: restriction endonuclease subunit S [Ancrocorticia sp.]|jgi:type I restriction enzyme S subunit|nr:restriction endonuclease subunit S [Ancrocorticia sp.]